MKYKDGLEVREGDVVTVRRDHRSIEGVVLHVLIPNSPEAEGWGVSEGGVMIEGGGFGLFFCESLADDEDIVFVHRGK